MTQEKDYVKNKFFFEIIGILAVILIAFFGYVTATLADMQLKIEENKAQFLQIETRLSEIQTDIIWIKQSLNE